MLIDELIEELEHRPGRRFVRNRLVAELVRSPGNAGIVGRLCKIAGVDQAAIPGGGELFGRDVVHERLAGQARVYKEKTTPKGKVGWG